jgi:hypothetical protein
LLGTPVNYHAGEPWKTHSETLDGFGAVKLAAFSCIDALNKKRLHA